MLLSLSVQILSSAAYTNIFLSTGIILLLLPNIYLCTYYLYGPMRNVFYARGQVGGGWALEIKTFGPVKWHRAVRRVSFGA